MPREFFGDVTRSSVAIGSRKWYTVPISLLSHAAIVGLMVLVPLMAPAMLPALGGGSIDVFAIEPPAPPAPPPPAIRRDTPVVANPHAAPTEAPSQITREPDIDPGFEDRHGVEGGTGIVVGTVEDGLQDAPPPAPPVPPQPIRIGGQIRAPQKVRDVAPLYPAMAQAARVQGMVIIEATIAADGRVVDARVLRSIPLLDQAALDAVRQWRFTPTLLNGTPVPVVMTVAVSFVLR